MVSDAVILAAIAGIYLSQGILYFKLGSAMSEVEKNAETIQRNTELIHDHVIEGTNPHPRHEDCPLCQRDQQYLKDLPGPV